MPVQTGMKYPRGLEDSGDKPVVRATYVEKIK